MAYLAKEDYTISTPILHLNEIMGEAAEASGKTEDVIRQEAETLADAEIQSLLSSKYEIATELLIDEPATRAAMIKKCMVDISLYHLHFTINPRNIPQLRVTAYEHCKDFLKAAQEGNVLVVGVPLVVDAISNTEIVSQSKFISKPFTDLSL
jgi:hypothetical protein